MAELKKFLIKGELKRGKQKLPFSREISAVSKSYAENKLKSLFGSNYGLKRNSIIVSSIEEV